MYDEKVKDMLGSGRIYINLIIRCILFYFILIMALRFMGKREVGELSVFDIVIYLIMSELLALGVTELDSSILKSLIPIVTLAFLQFLLSLLFLKHKKSRDIVDGIPSILIHNGVLNQNEMKRQRYNIDDLLSQLREKDISSLSEVEFAILENNGSLSVLKKTNCLIVHPSPVIQDGEINMNVLKDIHKDKEWLLKKLKEYGYENERLIFLCMLEKDRFYILEKKNEKENKKHNKKGGYYGS